MNRCPHCGGGLTDHSLALAERDGKIARLYRAGATQNELARWFDLTRGRISQILGEQGARVDEATAVERRRKGLARHWGHVA